MSQTDEDSKSSSISTQKPKHKKGREDSHKPRRIWQKQMDHLQTSTPVRLGGTKTPLTRSKIEEADDEEQGEEDLEKRMNRQIQQLQKHISENEYKTETVQRQTAYLLHKNSKKEEEEAGLLATIFGWPKWATLADRQANADWLIEQSGVKDEHLIMTFNDKKGRLSNYTKLRFSNQGLRDQFTYHWYKYIHKQNNTLHYYDINTRRSTNDKLIIRAQYSPERMMRSNFIKAGKDVLKEVGLDYDTWMNTDACTISDDKGLLLWIVFRHSTASAIIFADKTIFQPIHDKFEECLWRLRNTRPGKGKGKDDNQSPEGKGQSKGRNAKGKVGRAAFDFDFDYRRPFYIKYVKVENWDTNKEVQQEEDYEKKVERMQWEEAGMETDE